MQAALPGEILYQILQDQVLLGVHERVFEFFFELYVSENFDLIQDVRNFMDKNDIVAACINAWEKNGFDVFARSNWKRLRSHLPCVNDIDRMKILKSYRTSFNGPLYDLLDWVDICMLQELIYKPKQCSCHMCLSKQRHYMSCLQEKMKKKVQIS
jgi:hypothetical protein